MSRIAYVNGRYVAQPDASVNIEDRGYQFGDGIYEVVHLFAWNDPCVKFSCPCRCRAHPFGWCCAKWRGAIA